jgi:hypothetical protein
VKWIPHRTDGDQTPIEAKKFKHWIGTQEHWFCVHESLDHIGQWTVSDWASGRGVRHIEHLTLAACRNNPKDAARLTLNKLIEQHGESRVLAVLRSAPQRTKK